MCCFDQIYNNYHIYNIIIYSYNPALTYGKAKDPPKPIVQPHFTLFDGKCLSFNGYTVQTETESPFYTYRVRHVKITYYLVDDTISISEPVIEVKFIYTYL